jgi:hypothetical protein
MELGIQFQVQFFKRNSDSDSDSENQTQFQPVPVWFLLTETAIGD